MELMEDLDPEEARAIIDRRDLRDLNFLLSHIVAQTSKYRLDSQSCRAHKLAYSLTVLLRRLVGNVERRCASGSCS
jgi:hypothetical protein